MAESNVPGTIIGAYTVTTSNSNQARPFKRLWIGVTGNVTIRTLQGEDVQFLNVPVGWFDVAGLQVRTATTATSIVAVY
jgi:hypothetical protein